MRTFLSLLLLLSVMQSCVFRRQPKPKKVQIVRDGYAYQFEPDGTITLWVHDNGAYDRALKELCEDAKYICATEATGETHVVERLFKK